MFFHSRDESRSLVDLFLLSHQIDTMKYPSSFFTRSMIEYFCFVVLTSRFTYYRFFYGVR